MSNIFNSPWLFRIAVYLLLIQPALLLAQAESEPNDDLASADQVTAATDFTGKIGCGADRDDYFVTDLPDDGTIRLAIAYTNDSGDSGADATLYVYDSRGNQIGAVGTVNVKAGTTVRDTLKVYCRAIDKVYFRVNSAYCFSYAVNYAMEVPKRTADSELNNTFATAVPIVSGKATDGRIGYRTGSATDTDDYFVTVLPDDGTIKLSIDYTNNSNDSGADVALYVYDSKGNQIGVVGTVNVEKDKTVTAELAVYCRARDTVYFRINSAYCFAYSLKYGMDVPVRATDPEANASFATAAPIASGKTTDGRIGYRTGRATDTDDYFVTVLPDDGTIKLAIEYSNHSNDSGADAALYVYDSKGNQIGVVGTVNVEKDKTVTAELAVYCRAQDTVYFRINSAYCFAYSLKYGMDVPVRATDPEANASFATAAPIASGKTTDGRIGYRTGRATDTDDYFVTVLPDDGTIKVAIDYSNHSNDSGADVALYVYDSKGNQIGVVGTVNVEKDKTVTAELAVYCRARDTVYFRVNSAYCFAYSLKYGMDVPARATDPEENASFATAAPIASGKTTDGRIGYRTGSTTDTDDYFVTVLPDDGTIKLSIDYSNNSNDSGADVALYVYDSKGNQIGVVGTVNVEKKETVKADLSVYCRARDTVYFRINSAYCFGYGLKYDLIPPAFAADEEPNNSLAEATLAGVKNGLTGRIGYVGRSQDRDDYFRLANSELSSFTIIFEGDNASNDGGADMAVYVLNGRGQVLKTESIINVAPGRFTRELEFSCLPQDTLYLRVNSAYCFSYRASFEVTAEQPHAKIAYSRFGNRFAFVANSRKAERIVWDFGDGTTSTERYPVKEFPIGVYEVKLNATNEACNVTAITTESIRVDGIEHYSPKVATFDEPLGFFDLRFFGAGFDDKTVVTLSRNGKAVQPAKTGTPSAAELTTLFSFQDVTEGAYDVTVALSSGQSFEFPKGFTVEKDEPGVDLDVEIGGPARIRTNRWTDFTLNVTNNRKRMANGVVACIVTPRHVETNLAEILGSKTGQVVIKGDDWKQLSLDLDEFSEVYFGGDFDPNRDSVVHDYTAAYANLETYLKSDIDTLYGQPFRGTLHMMYVPIVRGMSTRKLHFKLLSDKNQSLNLAAYTLPYTLRANPVSGETLDWIHEAGMQGAALAEFAPNPALRWVGKNAGRIDILSQIAFTEGFDYIYGQNNANDEFYAQQGLALGVDVLGEFATPPGGSKSARETAESFQNQANKYSRNSKAIENQLKLGKFRPKTRKKLQDRYDNYQKLIKELTEKGADQAAVDAATANLKTWLTKQGINLSVKELQSLIDFPEDVEDTRPKRIKRRRVNSVRSFDPNAIYGPDGAGDRRYIRREGALDYLVTFENVDTAEATAQIVRVELQIDSDKYDLSNTYLSNVTFGGHTYFFEEGRQEYFEDFDLRPAKNLIVRVQGKLDTLSGRLDWQFTSLDPVTMQLPQGVDDGFLPPNVTSPEGEGSVSFTTRLQPTVVNGDSLGAQANIFFDDNDPIVTNVWSNLVDELPPVSRLSPTVSTTDDTTFTISYDAADAGSGVQDYYLRFRRLGDAWTSADVPLEDDGDTEIIIDPNFTYEFYIVAQDSTGNRESKAERAELTILNGTVGVRPDRDGLTGIEAFPNPSTGNGIFLRSEVRLRRAELMIVDPLGRVIYRRAATLEAGVAIPLSLNNLPPGIYTLRCTSAEGKVAVRQLVITR